MSNNLQSKKKTFVMAAMVILLCLVSIVGATFALFTSDVNDGKIGINTTSGRLKVDIVDAKSNPPVSVLGGTLGFVTNEGKIVQTDSVFFEPGATYHTEGFRVQNKGNITINFIVYISEDLDTPQGQEFADAFDVWITPDPTGGKNMVKLEQFDGRLEGDQLSEPYYLVFRMKESAGNTYQGKPFTGVGITVVAVQGNVEII